MTEQSEDRGRVVAIVGRPNVGKSALFNRLVRRRLAIVHQQSGVTRDRLVSEAKWDDERYQLIDTGGVGNMDRAAIKSSIDTGVRQQVDLALQDATVAIFVVDLQEGLTPLDEEVARVLHDGKATVVLAVNKADNPIHDDDTNDFDQFGFPVFPVSAMHNRGIDPLMTSVMELLPEGVEETEKEPLKVAVVGRPNVGKSSYVNRLLRDERVIVSEVPGTTRDSIEVPFTVGSGKQARHYTLIDTAGMRRSGKIDTAVERFSMMRAEKSIDRADICVLVTDCTQRITTQDKKIAAKILGSEKGCVLLVNKWDLSDETQRQFGKELQRVLAMMEYVPVVFASAESGYNIRRTVECIDHVAGQIGKTLPTGVLNRTILRAFETKQPPAIGGKRLKAYYSTQTGTNPIKISIFVNFPKTIQPAYRKYLTRAIRAAFGLEGAPIVLIFRARRPKKK